jgi:hypothetical protein
VSDTPIDGQAPVEHPKSAPDDRAENGPLDESEANAVRPYVDLGGLKILPRPDLRVRLEVDEASKKVHAVALDFQDSSIQVMPFAAPRNSGLWHEIRQQLSAQIAQQGGTTTPQTGVFGPELRAEIPAGAGAPGPRVVRFIGVDGPRWFLRGAITGRAAVDPAAGAFIEDLFRSIVVVRGATPMPPRDLIPLHVPPAAQAAAPTQNV